MSTSGTESAGMCSTTSGTGAPSGRFAVARPAADGGGGCPDIFVYAIAGVIDEYEKAGDMWWAQWLFESALGGFAWGGWLTAHRGRGLC